MKEVNTFPILYFSIPTNFSTNPQKDNKGKKIDLASTKVVVISLEVMQFFAKGFFSILSKTGKIQTVPLWEVITSLVQPFIEVTNYSMGIESFLLLPWLPSSIVVRLYEKNYYTSKKIERKFQRVVMFKIKGNHLLIHTYKQILPSKLHTLQISPLGHYSKVLQPFVPFAPSLNLPPSFYLESPLTTTHHTFKMNPPLPLVTWVYSISSYFWGSYFHLFLQLLDVLAS